MSKTPQLKQRDSNTPRKVWCCGSQVSKAKNNNTHTQAVIIFLRSFIWLAQRQKFCVDLITRLAQSIILFSGAHEWVFVCTLIYNKLYIMGSWSVMMLHFLGLHCLHSELIFVGQNRIKENRIEIILMNGLKLGARGDLLFYQNQNYLFVNF